MIFACVLPCTQPAHFDPALTADPKTWWEENGNATPILKVHMKAFWGKGILRSLVNI